MPSFKWDKVKKEKQALLEHRQDKHLHYGNYLDLKYGHAVRETPEYKPRAQCILTPYDMEVENKRNKEAEEKRKRLEQEKRRNKELKKLFKNKHK